MTDQATRRPAVSWQVDQWLRRRRSHASDWPVEKLLSLKGAATVSVVIPARNEASTVGEIVRTIRGELVDRAGLVDELVVVDSRSTDDTARVAAQAGATVVAEQEVLAQLPPMQGKGEALWKGMAASTGDLVVFVDGDLREFSATYVTGLLGPLLADESVVYVKGFYRRPFVGDGEVQPDGGGRVTELVARPLLNMHWPSLAGFVQPLAGEYAGRREALEQIPFMAHYGVEIGHLIDLHERYGLDALAQVDLGQRKHRHQSLRDLGVMASQIMLTVNDRLERYGRMIPVDGPATTLTQFRHGADPVVRELTMDARPPLRSLRSRTA